MKRYIFHYIHQGIKMEQKIIARSLRSAMEIFNKEMSHNKLLRIEPE